MTTADRHLVTQADARVAQDIIDAVDPDDDGLWESLTVEQLRLLLRGIISARLADVRWAGFVEGEQRGRKAAAAVVLAALRDEGLAK